ncbi:MAG: YhcH/YjgK/YiaL family protein, partial [Hungatella sp.]
LDGFTEGRYEFDGGFFLVQKGITKPMEEGDFEVHRKYVDVQMVMKGSEDLAWAEINDLKETIPYDSQRDAALYSGDTNHRMAITAGMCYIAFPHDGHRPIRHVEKPQKFVKIVMKLPVTSDRSFTKSAPDNK